MFFVLSKVLGFFAAPSNLLMRSRCSAIVLMADAADALRRAGVR